MQDGVRQSLLAFPRILKRRPLLDVQGQEAVRGAPRGVINRYIRLREDRISALLFLRHNRRRALRVG